MVELAVATNSVPPAWLTGRDDALVATLLDVLIERAEAMEG